MQFPTVRLLLTAATLVALAPATPASATERGADRFLSGTRQLTYEGRRSGECYFSPDGTELVFMSEREPGNPFFQIYILDLETGDIDRLSPGHGKATCPYFQAGTGLLQFASTHLDPDFETKAKEEYERRESGTPRRGAWDYDETYDIFLARPDGTILERLTDALGYDAEGGFSPDGSRIVFCSLRDAYPLEDLTDQQRAIFEEQPDYFGEIYIMNADGTGQTRLTDWPGYDGGPFFTPDGERIVWRHFSEDGLRADIYTMKTDGTDRRRLTDFGAMSWAPFFHPSGDYAIYTSNKLGFDNFELFLVDELGRHEPVRVTYTEGFDGLPTFSPDGSRMVWTSNHTESGYSQLFLADWDHEAALAAIAESPLRVDPGPSGELDPAITEDDLRAAATWLADDARGGRLTGTEGAAEAAEFIAAAFEGAGLEPAPGMDGFFQPFPFRSGVRMVEAGTELAVEQGAAAEPLALGTDFLPLTFSGNGEASAEVVFVGYGLVEPKEGGYDSYLGIDVEGKVALCLRDIPEAVPAERRQELAVYAGDRYKAKLAADRGAVGFLLVTGPNSPRGGEPIPFQESDRVSNVPVPAASVSGAVADRLLEPAGGGIGELQDALDGGEIDPHGGTVTGATVRLEVTLDPVTGTCRNVVGMIPPSEGVEEYVLLGAHYDHIGTGEGQGSLARAGEEGQVHNGADDNASGTAVVMELAASLAADLEPPHRGILVAAWSGEELGLVGSTHFASEPPVPLDHVRAYFNFDMVGRLRDNQLIVQAVASSPAWKGLLERRNIPAGFDLSLQNDPYLPTDLTAFYTEGVPGLSFFTGLHENYNRPVDDAATLDYAGMERIARFADRLARDVATPERELPYERVERSAPPSTRMGRRVSTGVIPDFSASGDSRMLVSDVRPGAPAEKAGILAGDVIVEFAGKSIASLQDYADALAGARAGEAVPIVVLRDGERIELTITPTAR